MITLRYSLVIEATADPSFFGFYAPDLPGFTGVGTSIEDCVEKARVAMDGMPRCLSNRECPSRRPRQTPASPFIISAASQAPPGSEPRSFASSPSRPAPGNRSPLT